MANFSGANNVDTELVYPLHTAVFENNLFLLTERLHVATKDDVNLLDLHGRSPLMLATVLGHVECAELLLKNGADANTQNKEMWLLSHEAVSLGNFEFLTHVLNYRDHQRALETLKILLDLRDSLQGNDDFYVEMSWEFTSWLRFVKNMCPSDTYKIYKSGSKIRIDTTLIDFDNSYRRKRGNQSFIFRFTGDEKAEIIFINYALKVAHVQIIDLNAEQKLEDFVPSKEVVAEKLLSPITTSYVDVENVGFERSKKSGLFSWIGLSNKEEEVEGFTCRVFNASNVDILTKTRMDHLKEEDKERYLESENKPLSFLMGLFEKKKNINSKDSLLNTPNFNDVYGGLTAQEYLKKPYDEVRIGRPLREDVHCNSFNASLWLADSFPLNLKDQIFPIIDLMSVRNVKFSRLKSFIQLQLPSGFPVRISIPLFHMINAQITFKHVNEPFFGERQVEGVEMDDLGLPVFRLQSELFEIPDDFIVHKSSVSLLFDNIGHTEIDYRTISTSENVPSKYNVYDLDDDYVYLLERFLKEDDFDEPESSVYNQQVQLAIEQSIVLSNCGHAFDNTLTSDVPLIESADDSEELDEFNLSEILKLSKEEEDRRKYEEELEEEELRQVLELSKMDL